MSSIDKSHTTEMARAASQGALTNSNQIKDTLNKMSKGIDQAARPVHTPTIDQAVESPHEFEQNVLMKSLSTLANMGMFENNVQPKKVMRHVKEDASFKSEKGEEAETFDRTTLSGASEAHTRVTARKGRGQHKHFGQNLGQSGQQLLEEYTMLFAKSVVAGNTPEARTEQRRRIQDVEARLREQGMSPEDLFGVQQHVRASARKEIAQLIKDALLNHVATPKKSVEWAISQRGLNNILDAAFLNDKLGGWDWGRGATLQNVVDNLTEEAKMQMGSVFLNEWEKELIRGGAQGRDAHPKDIKAFLEMAQRTGVDVNSWVKAWEDKKWDFGLQDLPENVLNKISAENPHEHDFHDNQQGAGYGKREAAEELREILDEKELLVEHYRTIFTKRYMDNSWRTRFTTAWGVRAIAGRLQKLGYTEFDFKQLELQAREMAKLRLIAMLKEAYLERVVLLSESGSRTKMSSKRLSKIKQRLMDMGVELTEEMLSGMRHEAESTVYNNAINKLAMVVVNETRGLSGDEKKEKEYLVKLVKSLEHRWEMEKRINAYELRKQTYFRRLFDRMGAFHYMDQKV